MTISEYQKKAMLTCMETCDNFAYMSTGLIGEIGEFYGKIAKAIRKDKAMVDFNALVTERGAQSMSESEISVLKAELGDTMWFCAGICSVMDWDLEEICDDNLAKLESRRRRGVIDGNGDER